MDLLSGKHGRRKDFLLEGGEADFCRGNQKYFCSGAPSGCILFYSLQNKNTTIFCLKFNRKMFNFKILGAKSPHPRPIVAMHTRYTMQCSIWVVTYNYTLCANVERQVSRSGHNWNFISHFGAVLTTSTTCA